MKFTLQISIFFLIIAFSTLKADAQQAINDKFETLKSDFYNNLYISKSKSYDILNQMNEMSLKSNNIYMILDYKLSNWKYALIYKDIESAKNSLSALLKKLNKYPVDVKSKYLLEIAAIYVDYQMIDLAEKYFTYVLEINEGNKNTENYISALNGIGITLAKKNRLNKAKEKFYESLILSREIKNPRIYIQCLQYYIDIFFYQDQLDSINVNIVKFHRSEYIHDTYYQSLYYNILAYYHYLRGNLDSAILFSRKVVVARESVINPINRLSGINNLGFMFLENKQYDSASYYLETFRDSIFNTKHISLINKNVEYLEKLYFHSKDAKKLIEFSEYKNRVDSLDDIQTEKINLISKLYQTSSKLEEYKQKTQDYQDVVIILIIITLVISVFIAFYIFYNRRLKVAVSNQDILIKDKINTLKEFETEVNNKNQLISLLSHDLINPINSSNQLLELLKNDFYTMDDKEKYEIILELNRASLNTYDLLKDILNWMKVSQNNLYKFHPTNVKISNLVQNIYEYLHIILDNRKQKIINKVSREHIINVDINHTSTILRNLITNSSKFSENGKDITIYSEITPKNYIIVVEDEGKGMKQEIIESLKKNSYNALLNAEKKEENSFGYGIVICRDLMKIHNGSLEYESDGKTGTKAKLIFDISILVKS